MLTKDNFFNEYILSQGTMYQWAAGTQAAARDPLQHLLPLILTDGDKAKSILRYTMKELAPPAAHNASQPNNLPYGLIGRGILMTAVNRHDGTISQVRKHDPFICPRFDITMIVLPRQARDKHREGTHPKQRSVSVERRGALHVLRGN